MSKLKPLCPECRDINVVEIDKPTAIKLGYQDIQENTYTDNCEKNIYECKNCGHIFGAISSNKDKK